MKKTRTTALRKKSVSAGRPTSEAAVLGQPGHQPGEQPGSWHLARTETERRLSDFEFGLERLAQAYYRWKAACLSAVCDVPLTGDDVAVLNVVRMGDDPKRLSEIGQLLNRVDVPNLQYATRKLTRAGLIETEGNSSRKETRYRVTLTGHAVTEAYAALRAATLPPMIDALEGWTAKSEATSAQLDLISGLYAQAAQIAITRRHQPDANKPSTSLRASRSNPESREVKTGLLRGKSPSQ